MNQILPWAVGHDALAVTVEYRLASELPDPCPAEDCCAGLPWTAEHTAGLSINPGRTIISVPAPKEHGPDQGLPDDRHWTAAFSAARCERDRYVARDGARPGERASEQITRKDTESGHESVVWLKVVQCWHRRLKLCTGSPSWLIRVVLVWAAPSLPASPREGRRLPGHPCSKFGEVRKAKALRLFTHRVKEHRNEGRHWASGGWPGWHFPSPWS
ncbi:hypothetical protein AB0M23_30340 [Streptomyces sp. NPDC052077]|uniref:hypothetical protein n=1 Tax=Streptomyces sp. NPDC052077 TaxID=3154757 RepID=UPI003440D28F